MYNDPVQILYENSLVIVASIFTPIIIDICHTYVNLYGIRNFTRFFATTITCVIVIIY